MADIQQNISCPFKENENAGMAAVCLCKLFLMDFLKKHCKPMTFGRSGKPAAAQTAEAFDCSKYIRGVDFVGIHGDEKKITLNGDRKK